MIKIFSRAYRHRGYGGNFRKWITTNSLKPYKSFGNGSAMRVSPVGFAFDNLEKVLEIAKKSAEVTHNHPEGIKGAQAIASAIFLAKIGKTKDEIKNFIEKQFNYDLNFTIEEIRQHFSTNATCQGSVPHSIVAFLDSTDYESAVRLAISLGGDTDTAAAMAGSIAIAYYKKMPAYIEKTAFEMLPIEFKEIVLDFEHKYGNF